MAVEKHWQQPELVQAFGNWRQAQALSEDLDLLESEALPIYVEDLYVGARDLIMQKEVASEYRFSDAALRTVRQEPTVYRSNLSVPKYQIYLASVIRTVDGETRFARLYNTQRTFDETIGAIEVESAAREALSEKPLSLSEYVQVFDLNSSHDGEQHVNTLHEDMERPPGGFIRYFYPAGGRFEKRGTEDLPPRITVADYVTLGHMIQYDMEH
jgi:hypothetical protein